MFVSAPNSTPGRVVLSASLCPYPLWVRIIGQSEIDILTPVVFKKIGRRFVGRNL